MTNTSTHSNPFTEKITAVRIINRDTGQLFNTINNFDFFPGTISLIAVVDFFNIKPNKDYILTVTILLENQNTYPIHATHINIPSEQLTALTSSGLGKATGNFDFNLTIEHPGDFCLSFILTSENSKHSSDVFYNYYSFLKR